MESFDRIDDFARSRNFEFPSDYHLVLDVEDKMDDERYWCGYYYVSHSGRNVFWLEKADISELFVNTECVVTQSRIRKFKNPHCFLVLILVPYT
jgi:hypothetical protein